MMRPFRIGPEQPGQPMPHHDHADVVDHTDM